MLLRYIFGVTEDPPPDRKGMWAVIYPDNSGYLDKEDSIDIFRDTFNKWFDIDYMLNFCTEHFEDIKHILGKGITVYEAANYLMDEAERLEQELDYAASTHSMADNLQSIFKPLDDNEDDLYEVQCSKARSRYSKKRGVGQILRIYALRIDPDTYIITGGAIKLTHQMKDRAHTRQEKTNILKVQDWLTDRNITFPEDLKQIS